MNIVDIFLIIPLLWFAYRGFTKGFIIGLASLAALILGIYAAVHFSYIASGFLAGNFDINQKWLPYIAFIVTFILVVFAVHLVGKILEKVVDIVALGFLNKLLGAAFGVIKAALFLSIILYLIGAFDPHDKLISKEKKERSLFYEPVAAIVPFIIPRLKLEDWNVNNPIEEIEEII